jgi:hypothetical protein
MPSIGITRGRKRIGGHCCVGPCLRSVGVLSWIIKDQIISASSSKTMRHFWWAGTSAVMS